MLILLAYPVSEASEEAVLDERVLYRPDLARKGPRALARTLTAYRPSILLAQRPPHPDAARAWRTAMPETPLLVVCRALDEATEATLDALAITARTMIPTDGAEPCATRALRLAERTWTETVTCAELPARRAAVRAVDGQRVALVGAGIVNLMTALALARDNREVSIFDAGADPRADADPSRYGCTRGGDNARMFTLTEADNYNDKRYDAAGDINVLLDRPVSARGWHIRDERPLLPAEQRWVREYRDIPPWLAHAYTEDILSFNREAHDAWARLRRSDPGLFEHVGLRDGILRLYTDHEHFGAQVERQRRIGALHRVLDSHGVAAQHPALSDACHAGTLAGGIEVTGFTLMVHAFVGGLVDELERLNVGLHFNEPVRALRWQRGEVAGLVTDGGLAQADHYVLSPGAYGDQLLRGTASQGQIQGVLGVWLTLPNLEPRLTYSLKIARRGHTAEDSNVTVAQDRDGNPALIVGSGYGWVGLDPTSIDATELEGLFAAVEDTARRFFPRAYVAALESGALASSRRLCVRPWTASSLGIFETAAARGGGATIVTGAHNTGGFSQAPAVAEAVVRALRGERHPMHVLYHPERRRRFLGPVSMRRTLAA